MTSYAKILFFFNFYSNLILKTIYLLGGFYEQKIKKIVSTFLIGASLIPVGGAFADEVSNILPEAKNTISYQNYTGYRNINSARNYLKGTHVLKVGDSNPNFRIWVNEYHSGPNNDVRVTNKLSTGGSNSFSARGYDYYVRYEGFSDYAKAYAGVTH